MSNNTHRLVSVDRVETLIETYGSNPATWPEQERAAAQALLRESASLQTLLAEAAQIDALIMADSPVATDNDALLARVVADLPNQTSRRRWLLPASLAASVAAVLLVVSSWSGHWSGSGAVLPVEPVAVNDMDYWLWQDVTGQVTFDNDNSEDVAIDFTGLLGPDAG